MPKNFDLSKHSKDDLRRIELSLNERPRKTQGHMTPQDKFTVLVARFT